MCSKFLVWYMVSAIISLLLSFNRGLTVFINSLRASLQCEIIQPETGSDFPTLPGTGSIWINFTS